MLLDSEEDVELPDMGGFLEVSPGPLQESYVCLITSHF